MIRYFKKIQDMVLKDETSTETNIETSFPVEMRPVVWLLGKTGAGKTSLIRCLTGLDSAEIGNGFEPCTRTAREFEYPSDDPLMRFLDTRGLGETHYNPEEDLRQCLNRSHVVLIVARIDDPVQNEVANSLREIRLQSPRTAMVVVHTGADIIVDEQQRKRSKSANQALFEDAVGATLPHIETAMPAETLGPQAQGVVELIELLADIIPEVALLLLEDQLRSSEKKAFAEVRSQVIRYASSAAAADLAPALGAIAVPSVQAGMLRALAKNYQVTWTRRRFSEYSVALGLSVLTRFGGSYLARQAAKLIPAYGQTIGALSAGSISFATTYALGRSAAYYLHQIQRGKTVNQDEIRTLYKDALTQAVKTTRKGQKKDTK